MCRRPVMLLLVAVLGAAAGTSPAVVFGVSRPHATIPVQSQTAVFSSRAELVVLDVVVTDRSGGYVIGLTRDAFTVYEEHQRQPIEIFSSHDVPATIGLLVDTSASMYALRDLVTAAVESFARLSNPDDEFFALTFNDSVLSVLPADRPFTNSSVVLEQSLRSAFAARGRTAMHDALAAGLAYAARGERTRQVLVIVSDGGDNASRATFEEVAHAAATANTVIYAIAMVDPTSHESRPDRLRALATLTGGTAQRPSDARAVQEGLAGVARDVRRSYTIGYVPPVDGPALRHVRVEARAASGERLHARTRTEYRRPGE